ncbi:MAG: T9SS type A sorting domain-containing protein [Bacteroidales bacterium]|nr:T9SS type A sorting domain-containing protein [Bacteroidales bacterium]
MKKVLFTILTAFISLTILAQTDILPPQLHLPTDGNDDQMPDIELDWYPVSGIGMNIMYEVQLDTDTLFSNPLVVETDLSAYKTSNLKFGTTYYWRVRATDDLGTSDWSAVYSFITFNQVTLDSPDDGDDDLDPATELKWKMRVGSNRISGVKRFEYEVSPDTSFNTITNHGTVLASVIPSTTQTYGFMTNLLRFDATYYWHIRVYHDADTSDWSERWEISTLVKPVLTTPADGANQQMVDVLLEWQDVSGAYEYIYELCTDPTFSQPCMNFVDSNSVKAPGLMFGATYYWRTKALHTVDTSEWSDDRSFTTINTVNLVSPANGGFDDALNPTLEWQELTGIDGYYLQVDTDDDFSDVDIIEVPKDDNTWTFVQTAITGTTYFWRMRAYQEGDTTMWSDTWHFTSGEEQGIHDVSAVYDVNIYPNPCDQLLNLDINSLKNLPAEVSILNLLGQTLTNEQISIGIGMNKQRINVASLENGIYMVRVKSGEYYFTKRFMINR